MKGAVLILVVLFPLVLAAQEKDPGPTRSQAEVASSIQMNTWSRSNDGSSIEPEIGTEIKADQESKTPQQPSTEPHQPAKPPAEPKPKIPGSMVGYIDDAIVRSQVRMRFDAAFHDNAPDRAEFFYGQCSCISGPGPNAVVADLNFQELYIDAEYAPASRFSFFVDVPVRWIQPQSITVPATPPFRPLTNEAGLSDVAAGFKLAALASFKRYLTFEFRAYFPSGNASTGLGTNHYGVEPELLYYQRISDRVALEAQVGDSHPIGGSSCPLPCNTNSTSMNLPNSQAFAGDVFFYGVGPSYVVYRGENVQIAPAIELVGWRVLGGFWTSSTTATNAFQGTVSADGINTVNLKLGTRTSIGAHSSFYIGYGHQLTHRVWYKEIVRVEYRYSF